MASGGGRGLLGGRSFGGETSLALKLCVTIGPPKKKKPMGGWVPRRISRLLGAPKIPQYRVEWKGWLPTPA